MGNQSVKFGTSKWEIVLDTGDNDLLFKYNGTTVFKEHANGAVTSANNVTAFWVAIMALQSSGAIVIVDIHVEAGGSNVCTTCSK